MNMNDVHQSSAASTPSFTPSSTPSSTSLNGLESRILALLGSGVSSEQTASAVGCSPSYISQLLSREDFASAVASLRYTSLTKHNERDASLDSLEDSLIEKLRDLLPLIMNPIQAAKVLQVVNAAKRRGASAPPDSIQVKEVVNLVIPSVLINKFTLQLTSDNRVLQAGDQALITMQSSSLQRLLPQNGSSQPQRIGDGSKRKQLATIDIDI